MNKAYVDVFEKCMRFVLVYGLSCNFNSNLRTSKQTKIYHKSNVFNIAYQEGIRIAFLFNLKLHDCAEWNKRAEGICQ